MSNAVLLARMVEALDRIAWRLLVVVGVLAFIAGVLLVAL